MFVLKRDGREEPVHFDKITARINKLAYGLNQEFCDPGTFKKKKTNAMKRLRGERERRTRAGVLSASEGLVLASYG